MNPITREWVQKAEADLATAQRELRARKQPNYDAACFHAQQCAEKYVKACLQARGVRFGKTHDVAALLQQLEDTIPQLALLRPQATLLTDYAVRFRYPGAFATRTQAREAVRAAIEIREQARLVLRLPAARSGRKVSAPRSKRPKKREKRR